MKSGLLLINYGKALIVFKLCSSSLGMSENENSKCTELDIIVQLSRVMIAKNDQVADQRSRSLVFKVYAPHV